MGDTAFQGPVETTTGTTHDRSPRQSLIRSRWAAIGAAVAVTVGVGGIGISNATIGSGERNVFLPITPCRLFDTRSTSPVGPRTSPLGVGETYTQTVWGANGNCTIPTDATAIAMNVTAVGGTAASYLTIWPSDVGRPLASSLNWVAGSPPTPNKVDVRLSADGKISLFNNLGTVDVLADVVGYYADHNFDDRYYTKAQAAAQAALVATPTIQRIAYTGTTVTANGTTSPPVKMRDLGTFVSHGVRAKVTWTSHVASTGTACNFQIMIDGQPSVAPDGAGLTGTGAVLSAASAVPVITVDVFDSLTAGAHTVELWYRSVSSACTENGGNYRRTVLIEEFGVAP
jgi:hypothetical protein